jgi:hypothetical protein
MSERRGFPGQALLAAGLAAGLALLCALGLDGLADTDPYRHLAYARQLWESHFTLRGHPHLPYTLLGQSGVDLWWGFHLLMVPFSFLGVLWGARVAGVAVAAAQAGSMAWLTRRLGQGQGWLFALAPTLLSGAFLNRAFAARPGHLTIPLLALNLAAGAGALSPGWAAGAAFAHGLLHLSSPLSPVFAGLGLLGALLARQPASVRGVMYSLGGLALAFVVRPDRAQYLPVALTHNLGALGHLSVGTLPQTGLELHPITLDYFLEFAGGVVLLLLAMLWLGRGRPRAGSPAMRAASLLAVGTSLALCFQGLRFLDYLLPFAALAAALHAPQPWPRWAWERPVGVALGLGVLWLTARNVKRSWVLGNALLPTPANLASFAGLIREKVPSGTLLVTEDLLYSGVLYSALPDYQYLCAYDPTLLYAASPERFWEWDHLVAEGRHCALPSCGPGVQDAQEVADAIRSLGSDWFVSFYTRTGYSVLPLLGDHPELFELVGTAPARSGRLSLWRVRHKG